MKEQFTVYLEPEVMRALSEYADQRGKPESLLAEAAIASFLSPDAAERQEAALTQRPDRITRQMERLERDVGISAETLSLLHPLLADGDAVPAGTNACVSSRQGCRTV